MVKTRKRKPLYSIFRTAIVVFSLLLSVNCLSAQTADRKISINVSSAPLTEVLKEIQEKSGYMILYNTQLIKDVKASVKLDNAPVDEILRRVLQKTSLTYKLNNNTIILVAKSTQSSKQSNGTRKDGTQGNVITVQGYVLDSKDNLPIIGAAVRIKDGDTAENPIVITTDSEGFFTCVMESMNPDNILVEVSYVGMDAQKVKYQVGTELILKLDANTVLEDVVVTGFYSRPKESFTGAATSISANELRKAGGRSLLTSIQNIDPSFNIAQNLQAGSNPNELATMTIRGHNSMPPVINLEDIRETNAATAQANLPLFIMDGFEITLQQVNDLDKERIENITILKDASATAIYGTRASNGIVVITSKEPEAGRLNISYNGNLNIEIPDFSSYDLLNAKEKLRYEWLSGLYDHPTEKNRIELLKLYNSRILEAERGVDTYWLKYPVRTGVGQSHSLFLDGGDRDLRYSASLAYNDITGVMKGSDRQTVNASFTLQYAVETLRFKNTTSIGNVIGKNSPYGNFQDYVNLNPYWKPYEDGNLIKELELPQVGTTMESVYYNPLYNAGLPHKDQQESLSINTNFSVEWFIIPSLSVRGRLGYTKAKSETDQFVSPKNTRFASISITDEDRYMRRGKYTYNTSTSDRYDMDLLFNYHGLFDKHSIFSSMGLTYADSKGRGYGVVGEGFPETAKPFLGMAQHYPKDSQPTGYDDLSRQAGFLINGNYTFDNRYIFDFSFRYEGSSKFGKDQRYAPFWSAGFGWNIKKEAFLADISWVDALRIRSSYGVTGSLNFSPYQAQRMYDLQYGMNYHGDYAAIIQAVGNPDLKWEQTKQLNLGLDFSLFNRATLTLDVYNKNTSNLLTDIGLPIATGFRTYRANMGEVENKGFDGNVSFTVLSNAPKEMSLRIGAGFAYNQNRIKKISKEVEAMNELIRNSSTNLKDPSRLYEVGQSLSTIYAVESAGLDPATGQEVFINKDGKLTYSWASEDQVAVADVQPKLNGTINLFFRYKGLTISSYFIYRVGGYNYNSTIANKVENVLNRHNNDKRVLYDRWQKPGDRAAFKSIADNSATNATSRFVMKDNFLQMSSLDIEYDFPADWTYEKLGIRKLSLGATFDELFYIASIKQERGTYYPFSRKASFRLRINF